MDLAATIVDHNLLGFGNLNPEAQASSSHRASLAKPLLGWLGFWLDEPAQH
jgi:hypothetical protein